jgi:hypothetical protein
MKIVAALLFTALLAVGIGAEETVKQTGFSWRKLGPALAEAKATQKMILVDIYTDW